MDISIGEKEMLRMHGLKATQDRMAILEFFGKDCEPLSAEDIVKKTKRKLDQVTVYRTINSFEEKGIIRKVDLRKPSAYFELAREHHHHHIVCKECGIIERLGTCTVLPLSRQVERQSKKFKRIQEHSLEFFGLCNSCVA